MKEPRPRHRKVRLFALVIVSLASLLCGALYLQSRLRRPLLSPTARGSTRARALEWVAVGDLTSSSRARAASNASIGCPPSPLQCRLTHIFSEVFVISLPRFAERAERTARQLDALGVAFTLVRAHDAASGSVHAFRELFWPSTSPPSAGSLGEVALLATQLDILAYVARASHIKTILILEDDALFRADFPSAFDAAVRNVPSDWRVFWIGAMMGPGFNTYAPPGGGVVRVHGGLQRVWGAYGLGLQRDATSIVARAMVDSRSSIDIGSYEALGKAFPLQQYLLWPAQVITNVYHGSQLEHNVEFSAEWWKSSVGVDPAMFDMTFGYSVGSESGFRAVCGDLRRNFVFGNDLRVYAAVAAGSPDACCTICGTQLPRCSAIMFLATDGSEVSTDVVALMAMRMRDPSPEAKLSFDVNVGSDGVPKFREGENCALLQGGGTDVGHELTPDVAVAREGSYLLAGRVRQERRVTNTES